MEEDNNSTREAGATGIDQSDNTDPGSALSSSPAAITLPDSARIPQSTMELHPHSSHAAASPSLLTAGDENNLLTHEKPQAERAPPDDQQFKPIVGCPRDGAPLERQGRTRESRTPEPLRDGNANRVHQLNDTARGRSRAPQSKNPPAKQVSRRTEEMMAQILRSRQLTQSFDDLTIVKDSATSKIAWQAFRRLDSTRLPPEVDKCLVTFKDILLRYMVREIKRRLAATTTLVLERLYDEKSVLPCAHPFCPAPGKHIPVSSFYFVLEDPKNPENAEQFCLSCVEGLWTGKDMCEPLEDPQVYPDEPLASVKASNSATKPTTSRVPTHGMDGAMDEAGLQVACHDNSGEEVISSSPIRSSALLRTNLVEGIYNAQALYSTSSLDTASALIAETVEPNGLAQAERSYTEDKPSSNIQHEVVQSIEQTDLESEPEMTTTTKSNKPKSLVITLRVCTPRERQLLKKRQEMETLMAHGSDAGERTKPVPRNRPDVTKASRIETIAVRRSARLRFATKRMVNRPNGKKNIPAKSRAARKAAAEEHGIQEGANIPLHAVEEVTDESDAEGTDTQGDAGILPESWTRDNCTSARPQVVGTMPPMPMSPEKIDRLFPPAYSLPSRPHPYGLGRSQAEGSAEQAREDLAADATIVHTQLDGADDTPPPESPILHQRRFTPNSPPKLYRSSRSSKSSTAGLLRIPRLTESPLINKPDDGMWNRAPSRIQLLAPFIRAGDSLRAADRDMFQAWKTVSLKQAEWESYVERLRDLREMFAGLGDETWPDDYSDVVRTRRHRSRGRREERRRH